MAGRRAGLDGKTGRMIFEVLRWAEALRPAWVACENVPRALRRFRNLALSLEALGYGCWAGRLVASDYGVPQNRRRAILMASRVRRPEPPAPTHCADPAPRLDGSQLLPHVSMAEALGWAGDAPDYADEPARTVCGHRQPAWVYDARGPAHNRSDRFPTDASSRAVTATTGKSSWLVDQSRAGLHPATEPSPTVVAAAGGQWVFNHPATTIQATPRVAPPGHHDRQFNGCTPVSLEELAILQGFPPDYPFVGNKTSRWLQIGNAVPAWLAEAIVRAVGNRMIPVAKGCEGAA